MLALKSCDPSIRMSGRVLLYQREAKTKDGARIIFVVQEITILLLWVRWWWALPAQPLNSLIKTSTICIVCLRVCCRVLKSESIELHKVVLIVTTQQLTATIDDRRP